MIVSIHKDVFQEGNTEKTFFVSQAENILSLEVTGSGTCELYISGQMEDADDFSRIAAIKMSNFTVAESITETGLYMIDIVALSKVKIELVSKSGDISVSGRTFDDSK